jgi:hypothetical protein
MNENDMFMVELKMYGSTYMRTFMARRMLNTPEMQGLAKLADAKGFGLEITRVDTMEEIEHFLEQLDR